MGKKVVCVFPSLNIGGAEKALSFVANCCDEAGMQVHAINIYGGPQTIQLNSGITTELVEMKRNGNRVGIYINKLFWLIKLRRKIKSYAPDLIVVFQSDITKAVVYSTWGLKIPKIGSERNDPTVLAKKLILRYRWAFNQCEAVVYQLQGAMNFFNAGKKQVVIPNPALSRMNGLARTRNQGNGNIVSAGRLCGQKNFPLLISAYKLALPHIGDRNLIIYGEGELKQQLIKLVNSLGLSSRVTFPGNVKDFTTMDDGGSIFVLSSNREGIPNALIEAMISGYACISTNCSPGGPLWLSDNGRRVCIVPMNDVDALSKAIISVANNESLRSQLIENSKEIISICKPERIRKMWLDLIEDVICNYKKN